MFMHRRYFLVLGMKPLLYSEREATVGGLGWKRVGFNISYYKTSSYKNPLLQREYAYYTLTFYMVSFFSSSFNFNNSLSKRKHANESVVR